MNVSSSDPTNLPRHRPSSKELSCNTNDEDEVTPRRSFRKRIKKIFKKRKESRTGFQRKNSISSLKTDTRSIKSLGTIDLDQNNEFHGQTDDNGFGLFAYEDIDHFHSRPRCSSSASLRLNTGTDSTISFETKSQKSPALNSQESLSDTEVETRSKLETKQSQVVSKKKTAFGMNILNAELSFVDMDIFSQDISKLYQEGKQQFKLGCYDKALSIQTEALESVSVYTSKRSSREDYTDIDEFNNFSSHGEESTLSFERLEAMIRHEIAQIKYYQARENSSSSISFTKGNDDSLQTTDFSNNSQPRLSSNLSKLYDQVEYARCKVAFCNYEYYTSQLRDVEESSDKSDLNQIFNKLYILHNLGALCEKDLHRYEEALGYYKHALDIEETVWCAYKQMESEILEKEVESYFSSDDELKNIRIQLKDFAQRKNGTKRKIGRIHHTCLGRFDLALFSSVSS